MNNDLPDRLMVPPVSGLEESYVSRAGLKLSAALRTFSLNVSDFIAADLGSNVGGFVDCLLRNGAAKVYSIDTAYGVLAWTLRKDPRVVVMERQNALHTELPEAVDIITIDTGWTRQVKILPAARKLLKPTGVIVTLVKPHYESQIAKTQRGVLTPEQSRTELGRVLHDIQNSGWTVCSIVQSPIVGQSGNMEFLALLKPLN
jgi:23S rRNA (cytidine1920-2'-O)/16S rRNA (cytidine1409-2'-O)-methyltransferase